MLSLKLRLRAAGSRAGGEVEARGETALEGCRRRLCHDRRAGLLLKVTARSLPQLNY